MNLLDRAIAAFAPRWGAERLYFRTVLAAARGYDAAKTGRRTDSWLSTGASANVEAQPALDRVRFRARELVRNNPYAARAVRSLAGHIVGQGFTLRPIEIADGTAERVRRNWDAFVENSDAATGTNFHGQIHLAVRALIQDGEVLLVWRDRPDVDLPLQVDVLEADHIDSGKTETRGDSTIIQGVEFDRDGRRTAYWLFDHHPGDVSVNSGLDRQSRRVEARYVDHLFDVLRPGQARGISWLAPVALKMRDLGEYEEAELIRKKIEACFTAFVKRHEEGPALGATTDEPEAKRRIERIHPGMINYLADGEEVTFGAPAATGGTGEYLTSQLMAIAAGIGLPFASLTGDLRQANYSSLREGKLEFWTSLDHWQWHMLLPMAYLPAWRRVHEAAARLGRGPREVPRVQAAMPKRPWVDPDKDGKATERDLRLGRLTWPQMVAEAGRDPDTQIEEIEDWLPFLKAAGIDFGTAKPGGAPGAGGEGTDATEQSTQADA